MDRLLLDIDTDDDTFYDLYDHCTAWVQKLTLENKISQNDLLKFYGLFKQAKDGDAVDSAAPSFTDFRGQK